MENERYVPLIKKEDLIHEQYYIGRCRNAHIARWNKEEEIFYHWRTKFSCKFIENIRCPEDEKHYDVFVTARVATPEEIKEEIPFQ